MITSCTNRPEKKRSYCRHRPPAQNSVHHSLRWIKSYSFIFRFLGPRRTRIWEANLGGYFKFWAMFCLYLLSRAKILNFVWLKFSNFLIKIISKNCLSFSGVEFLVLHVVDAVASEFNFLVVEVVVIPDTSIVSSAWGCMRAVHSAQRSVMPPPVALDVHFME